MTGCFGAAVDLIQVLSRSTDHSSLSDLNIEDLTTFDPALALVSGITFGGVGDPRAV